MLIFKILLKIDINQNTINNSVSLKNIYRVIKTFNNNLIVIGGG